MDTIENKVQQLKELSKKQKKLNEVKQDIADILGGADKEEKKKIAEKMAQTPYEDINQARNLQFIVPHIVKELYEHSGPKGEFVIPKKNISSTTTKPKGTPDKKYFTKRKEVLNTKIQSTKEQLKKQITKTKEIRGKEKKKMKEFKDKGKAFLHEKLQSTKARLTKAKKEKTKIEFEEYEENKSIEGVQASKETIKTLENLHRYLPLEFFTGKKSICYPGSSIDVSLAEVFGKNTIHIDQSKNDVEILQKNGYKAINDNINTHKKTYDLIFDSRSQVAAEAIDKLVSDNGYALIENAHGHANYFYDSPEYELVANISTGATTYKKVGEGNPFSSGDTNYYLFKKISKKTEEISKEKIEVTETKETTPEKKYKKFIKKLKEDFNNRKNQKKESKNTLQEGKKEQETAVQQDIENIKNSKIIEKIEAITTPEEKELIVNIVTDKSLQETEKIINQKKNDPKIKNLLKKIGQQILVLGAVVSVVWGIYEYGKNKAKMEQNKNKEQVSIQPDSKPDTTLLPQKLSITIDSLKKYIKQDQKDPKISYEKIAHIINSIPKEDTKEIIINYIKAKYIIGIQDIIGMNRHSQYQSNRSTGKIDENTLERIASPYFGLYSKEILDNQGIPQDVKNIYQKFLLGEINNHDANYIIISKSDFNLYLFTKEHKLLNRQVTLLGADIGKEAERVPYNGYNTNQGRIYGDKTINTNTPEGLFIIKDSSPLTDNYISDGPKTALILIPIHIVTQETDSSKYELRKYAMEIHPIYQPPENPTKYEKAMQSPEMDDNAISHGCANVRNDGIIKDNTTLRKSVVYITNGKK